MQKFEEYPNPAPFLPLVKSRISQLKKEKIMNGKEKEKGNLR